MINSWTWKQIGREEEDTCVKPGTSQYRQACVAENSMGAAADKFSSNSVQLSAWPRQGASPEPQSALL